MNRRRSKAIPGTRPWSPVVLSGNPPSGHRRLVAVSLLLFGTVAVLFGRTGGYSFINYDDHIYVIDNLHVSTGVTMENVSWAFRSGYAANWHPLTWLTHMLDCQFFALNPGPQHLVNVVLHGVSTVLLFLALSRLTGFTERSACVALLFALHPTHVESVAWIAERKDGLSGLFWFAAILAYAHYCARPTLRGYVAVAGLFALGLLSKPMVITLPCVLLLLDFWPLHRFQTFSQFWRVLREKVPLFALAGVASVITFWAQRGGGAVDSSDVSVPLRLGRALLGYAFYLEKTVWPSGLIIPYWTEFSIAPAPLLCAGTVFALATAAVCRHARRLGYLPAGWFWFLGTLVPVIGVVRVGSQSAADRYTYLPSVGLFILVTWGAADLAARWQVSRAGKTVAAAIVIATCAALTHRQIGYWKNSETLFLRTLAVDPANLLAVDRLAWSYATDLDPKLRNPARAVQLASIGVQLTERQNALFLQTLAAAHAESGEFELAVQVAKEALERTEPGQSAFATEVAANLELYRAGRAIHAR